MEGNDKGDGILMHDICFVYLFLYSSNSMTACDHGRIETRLIKDNGQSFSFPAVLPSNIANPIRRQIPTWTVMSLRNLSKLYSVCHQYG